MAAVSPSGTPGNSGDGAAERDLKGVRKQRKKGRGIDSGTVRLTGRALLWEKILLTSMPIVGIVGILDIFLYFGKSIWVQQYLSLLFGLTLALVFLRVPANKKSAGKLPWFDVVLSFAGLAVGLYPCIYYQDLIISIGIISPDKLVLGTIAVLLILESCRRLVGWPLTIIVMFFLLYAHFSYIFPGALEGRGVPWDRLITHLYLDQEAVLGIALRVTGTIVLAFIFFGQTLFSTGGGQFLTDVAMSVMGRYRGGPAKVAVLASSIFGTMSGSAVANVATTGVVTIPLMKKTGYLPYFAGAVEATASTGGQIMPPVMGAAAFLMGEFLGIPYAQVVLAALVPAILYYLALFVQIDRRAAKRNLKGLPREMLPSLKKVALAGWPFLIPMAALVYGLFVLFLEPDVVGLYAVGVTIVVAMCRKSTRLSLKKLLDVLQKTGQGMLEISVIGAAAGIILGVISITGLGFSFSVALIHLAGGSLPVLLLLAAAGAIVLGMGMTVTAAYILVVILLAPALTQLGMNPLAAHLFVFYYAVLSFLTPPVCMAVYTAASIANADPMRTAMQAIRLGIAAYLVPFVFAFSPGLLLIGSTGQIIREVILSALGIVIVGMGLEGYALRSLHWVERVLFIVGGLGLLAPHWAADIAGGSICLVLLLNEFLANRRATRMASVTYAGGGMQIDSANGKG
ncbi:MAG: TRAP transporter permease [Proteobacteria bacterium]|nr:TRAP transporter permease [Pseudomonadota bacterium]